MTHRYLLATALIVATATITAAAPPPRWLQLPTDNHAIYHDSPENFYMYVDRTFDGKAYKAYSGGAFGMVRTPIRHKDEVIHIHFHEGIDIAPLHRNRRGEPLDMVKAAAHGRVVHTSKIAGNSNYGLYVVLEHIHHGSPYYTLYAHLAEITVNNGDTISQGDTIGRIGYTGAGINRTRAHLHYEFCLLFNRSFKGWYQKHYPGQPYNHGSYNGLNLYGLDPLGLTRAVLALPDITVPEYIRGQTPLFRLTLATRPDIAERYPWLTDYLSPSPIANAWIVTFSNQFIPQSVEPTISTNQLPAVQWLGRPDIPLKWQSRGLILGDPATPRLSDAGKRLADLLTFTP